MRLKRPLLLEGQTKNKKHRAVPWGNNGKEGMASGQLNRQVYVTYGVTMGDVAWKWFSHAMC
eukprot:3721200-Pyramimonas_sp.AAC.1